MHKLVLPLWLLLLWASGIAVFEFTSDAATRRTRRPAAGRATRRAAARPARRVATPARSTSRIPTTGPAKYEPRTGAYLGAALDTSKIGNELRTQRLARDMRAWERTAGRKHAVYVHFLPFPHSDGSFPTWASDPKGWASPAEFCDAAAGVDAVPMLTLEPMTPHAFVREWAPGSASMQAVQGFARSAGIWGKPLFIRFAHEMNGSWYPWAEWNDKNRNQQRDPGEDTGFTAADYRQAYRNVATVFRRFAPNAALIWCPNSGLLGGGRRDPFGPFYPGDAMVDWVGLDFYERGWTMPMPGAHLWAGQFGHNLTRDANDDPNTTADESVNFYQTYAVGRKKPLMICETSATLSYRTDLPLSERSLLNHQWKAGYWNRNEYGWMQGVYGTSHYRAQQLLKPIDKTFPRVKAVVWFQIAKREYIPVQKTTNGRTEIVWFDNSWADYRVGGGVEENGSTPHARVELDLYRTLISSPHFLSRLP